MTQHPSCDGGEVQPFIVSATERSCVHAKAEPMTKRNFREAPKLAVSRDAEKCTTHLASFSTELFRQFPTMAGDFLIETIRILLIIKKLIRLI